ncbi:TRAP transporter large permease [Halovulum sp. GXIMD14794]
MILTTTIVGSILFGGFLFCLVIGVPISLALLFSGAGVFALEPMLNLVTAPLIMLQAMESFLLLAIPGFMFSALLMNKIGLTDDIVAISDVLVGRIRGGLAQVNVTASMLLGSVSGSSTADVAGLGSILIPVMRRGGYSGGFSVSVTAASSAIGSIIPPSILMVFYGATANVSISALFLAGYIPGLLVGFQQMAISYFYAKKHNVVTERVERTWKEVFLVLIRGLIPISVIFIIIGGIIFGIMTATEAAAVASVYVVLLGLLVYRNLTFSIVLETAIRTAILTGVVMLCVGAGSFFGWVLTFYDVLDFAKELLIEWSVGPTAFLFIVTALFLLLGTFLDPAPAILIFIPVIGPMSVALGVDPVLMGVVIVMALAIGKITPPYGISLMMACAVAKVPLMDSLRWAAVFFVAFGMLLAVLILFPGITLFLPRLVVPEIMSQGR